MDPRIFPSILIALNLVASVSYACHGDIKKMVYWIAAATLTYTVTF